MTKELDHMISRFPIYRSSVMELYSKSDDFKSLCEDYWNCTNNLGKLLAKADTPARLSNQYRLLSLELEQEVLECIISQHSGA